MRFVAVVVLCLACGSTLAEPLAAPGDLRLRHDLQLLNDTGAINIPLTAWPVSLGEVSNALKGIDAQSLSLSNKQAFDRLRDRLGWELDTGEFDFVFGAAVTSEPRVIRSFENTVREDAEVFAKLSWVGERLAFNLQATYADNPFDGDEFRLDGTYLGMALGNWMLTAGWQDRWFGPGYEGSLILTNNSRPTPGIMLQRINSTPFETRWLSWTGPWTLTSSMTWLDDERSIEDAYLWTLRGSIRPLQGLEIGITRTAQWCGENRPCDLETFWDLLVGNDNRGINVEAEDEPGNQLGGIDIRWVLPREIPAAVYMQWIGEDGRQGGGSIGSWLRQLGVEHWGRIAGISHRTHFEVSDTMCREGGFGFSDKKPNCSYEHGVYRTGYRYEGRVLGHGADGDAMSYSMGSTLVQSAGHTWNATIRYMEINREGAANPRHTISPTPQDILDIQLTHERETRFGRFYAGIAYEDIDDEASGQSDSDFAAFLHWSSR